MTRSSTRTSSRTSTRSSSNKKTTGYVTLFEVKKGDDGKEYIQFVKNTEYVNIEVNGVNVNGKTIYINDPAEKFEIMLESGILTESEVEQRISNIPDYIIEEGTVKLG
jgi:hypothetical protein